MANKILLCGLNGAGKSTLGRKLAEVSGWKFADAEDYYFPHPGDYTFSRTKEEVTALLLRDLERHGSFIFASVRGDFGEAVVSRFTHAVLVAAPRGLRLERVRARSKKEDPAFVDMVSRRPESLVEDWLTTLALPVIRVDGTRPPEENAAYILRSL